MTSHIASLTSSKSIPRGTLSIRMEIDRLKMLMVVPMTRIEKMNVQIGSRYVRDGKNVIMREEIKTPMDDNRSPRT